MDCLFCKIVNGEIPADKVAENDNFLAFRDIDPQAPVHILVIPKEHIPDFDQANEERLKGLIGFTKKIIKNEQLVKGYRLVINCKEDGGQAVDHLHLHILGKRKMTWPPG